MDRRADFQKTKLRKKEREKNKIENAEIYVK